MKTEKNRFSLFAQRWLLLCILLMTGILVNAAPDQARTTARGKVVDTSGEAIIGVSIMIRGTSQGAITDYNGNFTLNGVKVGDMLDFSFIGYVKAEKKFDGKDMTVIMMEDNNELGEVEVVAFGTQKKESVVAAITTINPADLKVPSSNLTTAFAGRMAGMIAYQRSGEPGADDASFFIRGITTFGYNQNPLILIDNIELTTADLARLSTDDIESFSIMKDATATALYGARGANGVIYVKTKEGRKGKAKLNIRVENSISRSTKEVELADPVTYMQLYNEAIVTRDPSQPLYFSEDKIARTVPGSNSMIYPATDWKDELLKDFTMNQRANVNISGGGDVARYYVAASFAQDNGILKQDGNNNFNTNIRLRKYTLRSNVNIDVTKTTELIVRLSGAFDNYTGPVTSGTDLYKMAMKASPVLFPAVYPVDDAHRYVQHTLFGNATDGTYYLNPYAEMVRGYKEYERSNLGAQVELKQKLDFITKGLSVRAMINASRISYYEQPRWYSPYYYGLSSYDPYSGEYSIDMLNAEGSYAGTEYLTFDSSKSTKQLTSTTYIEGAVNYNREFDKHGVSGLLVLQINNRKYPNSTTLEGSLPYKNLGLSGRFTYAYDGRYFGEFNFGYNGSERFQKDNRWGFFPSFGLGWMVSNEKFMEGLQNIFSKVKLRASYGIVGNDNIGSSRFLYLSQISMNSSDVAASFGYNEGAYKRNGVLVGRYANPEITWEKARKINYALEVSLWNELNMTFEYYTEKRTNILQSRASIPHSLGLKATPYANIGEAKGSGVDIAIDYNKRIGTKGWVQARANFTYATSEYTKYEELDWGTPWKSHIGYPTTQTWGYIAEGLFIDEADVYNSPKQFGDYKAGDIRYRDLNGDNQITEADMAPIGYPTTPEITYGFGPSFGFGNWDFSFFFQGSARSSFFLSYSQMSPFFRASGSNGMGGDYDSHKMTTVNNLAKVIADDHWSEDNKNANAMWPRLSTTSISNNSQTNTWFMRNGGFLRLKQIEVGYTLPKKTLSKIGVSDLRIYLTGSNIFSISSFKDWDVEMAGNGLGYPLQQTFNIGLNLTF